MEHEKYKVMVTDLRGEKPVAKEVAMMVIDKDEKFDLFWNWYMNDVAEQLKKKRGVTVTFKAGEYSIIRKKNKQLLYNVKVTGHTASTPAERRRQTRIAGGTLRAKVI